MTNWIFDITPHVGVGPVKLGMHMSDVVDAMGQPEHAHDNRHGYLSGFMVDYDESGRVEYIELANSPLYQATFHGIELHKVTVPEALNIVCQLDSYDDNDPELGYSYIFRKLQLSLWRGTIPQDDGDDDGKFFEAVGIAVDDYFV